MKALFSTEGLNPLHSFRRWRESLVGRGVPLEQTRLDDRPFQAKLEAASVGPLVLTRVAHGAMRSEATRGLIRRNGKDGTVVVIFKLAGTAMRSQDDRSSVQRPGEFVVIDHRPAAHESSTDSQSMFLELPRERLEGVLGSARLYTSLTMGADVVSTELTVKFFHELVRLRDQLDPDSATRMASVGVDLIVASIAERMALDLPQPLGGNVLVQRAKAHVEANLGDPSLDPPQLAAAVGVSPRRLQQLFHERGQDVSDWIWQRRLEVAADRLTDPAFTNLTIATLAAGCGFTSRVSFTRRFKSRFGLTPSDFRYAVGLSPE